MSKPIFNKSNDEIITYWREVMGTLNHPDRRKFSSQVNIEEHCEKMIKRAEKDKENETN